MKTEIGYVCGRGHFEFYSDPQYDGSCGSHRVAGVYVEKDVDVEFYPPTDHDCGYSYQEYNLNLDEAMHHLGRQIDTWRNAE